MIRIALVLGLLTLAGCAEEPAHPAATADQVMAAQYRAKGIQGPISGAEADVIDHAYLQQLTAKPISAGRVSDQRGDNNF